MARRSSSIPFDKSALVKLIEPICNAHGLELVDIALLNERGAVLRVIIDRESPNPSSERAERIVTSSKLSSPFPRSHVTLADCQAVSRDISALLDVHEELAPQGAYRLEVTSPGVDRPLVRLKDFQRFCGAEVRVFTKEPLEGTKRRIQGVLERVEDGRITVAVADANGTQRWDIELENIEKAHVVYRFE